MKETLKELGIIFNSKERKGLVKLLLLLTFGMFLEVLGLGILVPALSIILDSNSLDFYLSQFTLTKNFLIDFTYTELIISVLFAIVALYCLKTLFLIFLTYRQHSFISSLLASTGNTMFKGYLNQPLLFHKNQHSSKFLKNLQIEIINLGSFCLALLSIGIEIALTLSVAVTLIIIDPIGALILAVWFLVMSSAYFQTTKRKLLRWGEERQFLDKEIAKTSLEAINGIKEVLMLNRKDFFMNNFEKTNKRRFRLSAYHNTISNTPRYYLEFISVLALILYIVYSINIGVETTQIMTSLGVYVVATFRMIPSINRIIAARQNLKYFKSSVKVVSEDFQNFKSEENINDKNIKELNLGGEIKFNNVSFGYSNELILDNTNFSIPNGKTIGIIGESGSGKSTLIDLISGLIPPDKGSITYDNIDIKDFGNVWRENIGYVSQNVFLSDDTILRNIAFGIPDNKIDQDQVRKVINEAMLSSLIESLDQGWDTSIGERGEQLSGGQRQRLGIARALYNNPKILLLDEATSALDNETEKLIMEYIHSLKGSKTIIIIAHRLSTLAQCDNVYTFKKGQLFETKL